MLRRFGKDGIACSAARQRHGKPSKPFQRFLRTASAGLPLFLLVHPGLLSGQNALNPPSTAPWGISGSPPDAAANPTPPAVEPAQLTSCQVRVLSALNSRFPDANLTAANLLPEPPRDPRFVVENVNIHGTAAQLASVKKGRYPSRGHAFLRVLIGYGPSLHVVAGPSKLDPHALVFSRTSFSAHFDSAWPNTPIGFVIHVVLDAMRPKKRNPCP
ncbi:MAG: hypothetical protein ABSF23_02875 [Terracidiphilus sp.]|jgi:hypothetical protein